MTDVREAIAKSVDFEKSERLVIRRLESLQNPADLVNFVHKYTVFNGCFAGGVAGLAGRIHMMDSVFRHSGTAISACSGVASVIASHVFFAAEDEYSDRDTEARITHRQLGQTFLLGVLDYFEVDHTGFDQMFPLDADFGQLLADIRAAYLLPCSAVTEHDIFAAMGFHIGAELLADREFNIIDKFLHLHYPGLTAYLEAYTTPQNPIPAYQWVSLHTFVEEEHLEHAYLAAEVAFAHYAGDLSEEAIMARTIQGFRSFLDVQAAFYHNSEMKPTDTL
ncbi:hypothetical protein [Streptosporangium sp. H16]|uniref:hypothetical protein n=1 Tax=Streptosporangium sp. H16 TaxID=3444184 RepID=UPI003F78C333